MSMKYLPYLFLLVLGLKNILLHILSDTIMVTPTFSLVLFAWNTFFHPFPKIVPTIDSAVCFLEETNNRSCLLIQSNSLCLFTEELRQLILRIIWVS